MMASANDPVRSLRLVVADSDVRLRKELCQELRGAGYRVVTEAEEGCEAVMHARGLRPDLVVMAGAMQGMDGIAAAEILHRERIAPVVLLLDDSNDSNDSDGRSHLEFVRRAVRAGVVGMVHRPFQIATLRPVIETGRGRWVIERDQERRLQRLQAKEETRVVVEAAKEVLIAACGMSETRAYRTLQLRSMNTRRPLKEVAQAVLDTYHQQPPVSL